MPALRYLGDPDLMKLLGLGKWLFDVGSKVHYAQFWRVPCGFQLFDGTVSEMPGSSGRSWPIVGKGNKTLTLPTSQGSTQSTPERDMNSMNLD